MRGFPEINGSSHTDGLRSLIGITGPGMLLLLLALLVVGCGPGAGPDTESDRASAPEITITSPTRSAEAEPASPAAESDSGAPAVATGELDRPREPLPMAEPTEAAPADVAEPATDSMPPSEPPEEPAVSDTEASSAAGYVVGEGSEATFTVNEKLAWLDLPNDAVMRTTGLSGTIFLDGPPTVIELDLHSMTSDSDRRDGYVQQRMFPDHRTATFTVTDLGDLPNPLPVGEVINKEVPGELSIREVTKPIMFEIEARLDEEQLFVLGRTTFTWEELEIPPPNIPGRIQVQDEVKVQVLLAATPAGDGS